MASQKQLIDVNGVFSPSVEAWIRDENLEEKGFDYSVVTVLGCQSSGKSTLLNELFGTTFEIMDASRGRNQTTKGLWLAKDSVGKEATLVIDVEGTDSRERGEDRLTFEHRAALFSLALADAVVINIWYNDLGRYTASNYGLLKTVLGVNLELFQQQEEPPKTIMLFVIRDYCEAHTPLEMLMNMLHSDISSIWKEILKPEHLKDSTPDDYFVFKTVGLPSRLTDPAAFRAKAADLREMWKRECRPKRYSRLVPADGFAYYAKSVWDTILSSSELDIPSQKEMLATYRCEELKNAALEEACKDFPAFMTRARDGTLTASDFTWAVAAVEKALEMYDTTACRYQEGVFLKKRTQLLQALQAEIQKIVDALLTHVRQYISKKSSEALTFICAAKVGIDDSSAPSREVRLDSWAEFNTASARWLQESMRAFDKISAGLSLEYQSRENGSRHTMKFDASVAKQAFKESLEASLLRVREKEMEDFQKVATQLASEALGDIVRHWAGKELTPEGFWARVSKDVSHAIHHLSQTAQEAFYGLQSSEDATEAKWKAFSARITVEELFSKIQSVCDWLHNHIFARFQQFFDQDEDNVPRQWQSLTGDQIKEAYVKSRESALVLLQLFQTVHIKCPEVTADPSLTKYVATKQLMTEDKREEVLRKANKQMLKACQEAQFIQTTGGQGAKIPWWMWILLLALGYNEITMVLFSPFFLIIALLGVLIGGASYATGNARLPLQLSRVALHTAMETISSVTSTFTEDAGPPHHAPPPTSKTLDS